MDVFEIRDDFYLKGQPFKILSGAIHYFRIDPADWYHSLFNLKALGFNTVETYVPWNVHEPRKGQFDFSGRLDLERFIQTAHPRTLHDCKTVALYLCRVGIWWIASLALGRRYAHPLIGPSLYRSG